MSGRMLVCDVMRFALVEAAECLGWTGDHILGGRASSRLNVPHAMRRVFSPCIVRKCPSLLSLRLAQMRMRSEQPLLGLLATPRGANRVSSASGLRSRLFVSEPGSQLSFGAIVQHVSCRRPTRQQSLPTTPAHGGLARNPPRLYFRNAITCDHMPITCQNGANLSYAGLASETAFGRLTRDALRDLFSCRPLSSLETRLGQFFACHIPLCRPVRALGIISHHFPCCVIQVYPTSRCGCHE